MAGQGGEAKGMALPNSLGNGAFCAPKAASPEPQVSQSRSSNPPDSEPSLLLPAPCSTPAPRSKRPVLSSNHKAKPNLCVASGEPLHPLCFCVTLEETVDPGYSARKPLSLSPQVSRLSGQPSRLDVQEHASWTLTPLQRGCAP